MTLAAACAIKQRESSDHPATMHHLLTDCIMEALVHGYDIEYNGWYAARLTFEQEDAISLMREDELDGALNPWSTYQASL